MKKSYLHFLLICIVAACSQKLSPQFTSNQVIDNYVLNPEIDFYHKAFGDISFINDPTALKKALRKKEYKLEDVLLYGYSTAYPKYEYLILKPATDTAYVQGQFDFRSDTLIGGVPLTFLGNSLSDAFPESDWEYILSNSNFGIADGLKLSISTVSKPNNSFANYLQAYRKVESFPTLNSSDEGIKLQFELSYLSMLGPSTKFFELINEWEKKFPIRDTTVSKIEQHAIKGLEEVQEQILELTQQAQVVMFNENHFYPSHRFLVKELLPELRNQGFTHLALEALFEDSTLNTSSLPLLETGFYTREQTFYELIRTAQNLGFTLVSFDSFENPGERESIQAQSLYTKTLRTDSTSRVVVLSGLSHIQERRLDEKGKKWMAEIFKEKYGIDPVTFSQSHLAHYASKIDSEICIVPSGKVGSYYSITDFQIINSLKWYDENELYSSDLKSAKQLNIYQKSSDWISDADFYFRIPQQVRLVKDDSYKKYQLEEGIYQFVLTDDSGKILSNEKIEVK
ncbi:MAG: hypothetical protein HRT61_05665 [Ekhidna sp.]|nr:hypothetical protein [Ekhidna sp.]